MCSRVVSAAVKAQICQCTKSVDSAECRCGTFDGISWGISFFRSPPFVNLATSEMWCWSGGREIFWNCLCVTVLCTVIMVTVVRAVLTGQSTRSGCNIAWFSSLSSEHLSSWCYIYLIFLLHSLLYLLISWAWWDWPLTWLTNHCPSVLWHCWLGHLTHEIVPKMTYNLLSGTLNPTILYFLL